MLKKIILIYVLLFLSFNICAQGWVNIYDTGSWGSIFHRDAENNFIIRIERTILKISNEGHLLWSDGLGNYYLNNFELTSNDDFLLLQTDRSVEPENASVTLLDVNREIEWEYQLNYPHPDSTSVQRTDAMAAVQDADGNYWVLGDIEEHLDGLPPSESYFNYQPFVVKLSPSGEKLSFHTNYNTLPPLNFSPYKSIAIQASPNGGFVLMTEGQSISIGGDFPGFTKINTAGEIEWQQHLYHQLIDLEHEGLEYVVWTFARDMVITKSGEIVTAGMSQPKDVYLGVPYLAIINNDGSLQSFIPLDIPFNQEEFFLNIEITDIQAYGEHFVILYDGLVGETYSMGFVIVDREGNILQNTFYENLNIAITSDNSKKIMVLEEGGFAIIGGGLDLTLIKTDSLGNCYPNTQFSATDTGLGLYEFENQSEYADSYIWEFGDGHTDTTAMTSHQYTAIGTYEVCLTATNLCDSFKKCETIEVSEVTNIEVHEWEQGLLVYPNPVRNTQLFVEIPQKSEPPILTLYNSFGQQIQASVNSDFLDTNELEAGVYYLAIEVKGEKAVRKIIVY